MPKLAMICLFVGLLASCSDPSGPSSRIGQYELRTMNGQPVPVTVDFPMGELTVTSVAGGSLLLRADGTHLTTITLRGRRDGESSTVTETISFLPAANYSIERSTIVLPLVNWPIAVGEFSADNSVLTVQFGAPWGIMAFER